MFVIDQLQVSLHRNIPSFVFQDFRKLVVQIRCAMNKKIGVDLKIRCGNAYQHPTLAPNPKILHPYPLLYIVESRYTHDSCLLISKAP
jgi:hypothetical protein